MLGSRQRDRGRNITFYTVNFGHVMSYGLHKPSGLALIEITSDAPAHVIIDNALEHSFILFTEKHVCLRHSSQVVGSLSRAKGRGAKEAKEAKGPKRPRGQRGQEAKEAKGPQASSSRIHPIPHI